MPDPVDNLMALADGLVAALNEKDFSLPLTAEWKDNPIAELADSALKNPRIWVVDFGETEETQHGVPVQEYELLLVVQRKFGPHENDVEECRKLSMLVEEITRFCRSTTLEVAGWGVVCFKTERTRARDFKAYNEKRLFRAEVSTFWREG